MYCRFIFGMETVLYLCSVQLATGTRYFCYFKNFREFYLMT